MENTDDKLTMLHHISQPAFLVKNGRITAVNDAAQRHWIREGAEVTALLQTGQEEYAQFREGCLYLTLRLEDAVSCASVTNLGNSHLFVLEQEEDRRELRAMALAAQILRFPLSSTMIVADRLSQEEALQQDPVLQAQAGKLNRGLYQIMRSLCNMSDAYRYQEETTFHGEIRDICALVREQMELAQPIMAQAGTTLRFQAPYEAIFGLVDAEKLERAISNMLSNTLKFAHPGNSVEARLRRAGKVLLLTVQDDGPGIPESLVGTVHRRYLRSPGLEDSRYGLGLGMVMIRTAATAHGGTVLMEQGTDFGLRLTLTLPIRQSVDPLLRSPILRVDYAGERDHLLLELADTLPPELYIDP